jgi:hypothetical protein
MDYALIGTIARLTNTRPNWDREVTRAVGTARVCAIAALIRALGAEVEYADLGGIELSQARPELPDRPLIATNAIVRDLPSVKRIYEQAGHATARVSVDIESQGTVMAAVDRYGSMASSRRRVPASGTGASNTNPSARSGRAAASSSAIGAPMLWPTITNGLRSAFTTAVTSAANRS